MQYSEAIEILLVEDDPHDEELTLHVLSDEKLCNSIRIARDGEEALEMLFGNGVMPPMTPLPTLILLDLKLPKVDGIEVLKAIKSNPVTRTVPVVVMTSSKLDEDLVRSYDLGTNSYVQKPVDFAQFRTTVKQLGYYWLVINQPPPATMTRRSSAALN